MTDAHRRNVALLVAGCFFMELLDATIIVTAIPEISASLGVTANATALVMTVYLVTVAVLIPLSGWLTLRFGYRPVFLAAVAIFTIASIGCAASQTLAELVVTRMLQGVGGAMMVPVGRMVVFGTAEKSQVMRLMSYVVWPALLAPVVAPLLGGVITTYASWRWLFIINVPLGAIAFACALRLVHGRSDEAPPRLDRLGVLLVGGGLGALTYLAHIVSERHTDWLVAAILGVASAGLLTAAVKHLLRVEAPLVDLRTLRIPTFGNAMAGSALLFIVIGAIPFLLPLLFQTIFGWSPIKSGAVVLFVFLGNIGIKPATTFLYTRFGFRRVLFVAATILGLTTIGCALLIADTPLAVIIALSLVSGAARSVSMTGYSTLALVDVPPEQMRSANALAVIALQLFFGLAIAVGTMALRLGDVVGSVLPGPDDARSAYAVAFLVLAVLTAVAVVIVLRLHPAAGRALTAGVGADAAPAPTSA